MIALVWMLQPHGGCSDCMHRCVSDLSLGRLSFLHAVWLRQAKSMLNRHNPETPLHVAYVADLKLRELAKTV